MPTFVKTPVGNTELGLRLGFMSSTLNLQFGSVSKEQCLLLLDEVQRVSLEALFGEGFRDRAQSV